MGGAPVLPLGSGPESMIFEIKWHRDIFTSVFWKFASEDNNVSLFSK
jgi:hypothetical protein